MAAAVDNDIDSFIRDQKAKLASERRALKPREIHRARGTEDHVKAILHNSGDDYKDLWCKYHTQKRKGNNKENTSPRRKVDKLNLEAVAARGEEIQEWEEYDEIWEKIHKQPSPRTHGHPEHNTDRSGGDAGLHFQGGFDGHGHTYPKHKPVPTLDLGTNVKRAEKKLDQLEYKDIWKEMHPGQRQTVDQSAGKGGRKQWEIPDTAAAEQPLPLGQYETTQQRLQRQRQEDYNKFLKSQNQGNRTWREPSAEKVLPVGENEGKKRQLEAERNREYNEFLKSKPDGKRTWQEPQGETLPLGGYEEKRRAVEQERKREYQEYLKQQSYGGRPSLIHQTDEFKASNINFPGLNDSDAAKLDKVRERNDEYNKFLREKEGGRRPRNAGDQDDDTYATLPGLRYSSSAKARQQEKQRNLEYNQYLASKRLPAARGDDGVILAPRKGWATPTYEDMLEQKRREEQQYRKRNDPAYDYPLESSRRAAIAGDPSYYATLPIGQQTEIEKQRQKEQYRNDLQKQMQEAAEGKRREKQLDLKVDFTGLLDPEESNKVLQARGTKTRQPHVQAYREKLVGSLEKLDDISPRSELILGRRRQRDQKFGGYGVGGTGILDQPLNLTSGAPSGGLLNTGYESLLEAPRVSTLAPPAGLEYTPASYVTGAGTFGQSSVDEAYNFYATRNPLEDVPVGGGGRGGGRAPNLIIGRPGAGDQELGSFGGGGGGGPGARRVNHREGGQPVTGMADFPTDDDKKIEAQRKAQAYQAELARQIEEKKIKKQREREEKERYDMKLEREAQEYNPYGRGGGGAPMRDDHGNILADLRTMRRDNDNLDSPRKTVTFQSPRAPPGELRDDLFGPPPVQTTAEGEQTFARGGHGIFGLPKTEAEKSQSEKYKLDLKRQIEERKMEELRKKEEERQAEEREQRRVEEQQQRMQAEYEEERRKIKEKEEEARKKNEELVRLAEERKREAEERRRAAEDARFEEERKEKEAEFNARLAEARGSSPPVPAARHRTQNLDEPSTSNQEPSAVPRAQSADVLNQLAAMRQQLQNERQRVETMLKNEKNDPDVFDPRLVQRPPPAPVVRPEIDVFETALQGNAVQVRRTPGDRPNPAAMDEFAALKHKDNSDSRKEFLRLFPDQPGSADTLEAQQAALLRQQEQNLRNLREQREYDSGYPKGPVPPRSAHTRTPQQLHSDSAFVDVESVNYFPDDFDDLPAASRRRNESARSRRRARQDASPRIPARRDSSPRLTSRRSIDPFGSTTSLNVDRLSKKNEERLKKLRELQGDDISLYDPDDVLDRFMSKQSHNRPPSGQTLQDDTWLFAGSKASGY